MISFFDMPGFCRRKSYASPTSHPYTSFRFCQSTQITGFFFQILCSASQISESSSSSSSVPSRSNQVAFLGNSQPAFLSEDQKPITSTKTTGKEANAGFSLSTTGKRPTKE